jgi:zinc protease
VKETEVAVNVGSTAPGLSGATLTGFTVLARPGKDTAQIEKLVFAEVDRLKHEPVTPEELGRVRMQFRRQLAQQSQSTLFRALALGQYEASYGRPELLNSTLPSLEQVTAEDLQRAVRAYFSESHRSVILTVAGGPPPVRPAPQTIGDRGIALGLAEQKGRAPVSNDVLRVKLPVPVESVLDNGLSVVIVEDHRQPIVVAQLNVSGAGSLYDPPELPGLAGITAQMLRQGTKNRSSKQISADIENLGAILTVSSGFGSSATSLIASGLTDNFDAWFGLAADVLLHPVFPVDELNGFKQRLNSQFHQARATSSFLATERFNDAVFGGHPARVVATPPQVVATLTSDTLRKWYADVYDPENAILAIVGDVDGNRVIRTIRESLGSWQKTGRKEVMPPSPVPVPATHLYLVDRPNSSQTTLLVGNIAIDRRDPDYIPAAVMIQIVGGAETGRLALNLRDQRGYAFGASMTLSALKYPGPWRIATDVRADATEDAIRQVLSEIRRIRDEPVPQAELDGGKRALAARFALSLEDPGQLLNYLAIQKIYGFSADYWDTYPAKIMEVSAQEVQRVAQRLINPDAVVIVAVGDRHRIEPMLAKFGPVAVFDTNGLPVH